MLSLAQTYGTPLYVTDLVPIRQKYEVLKEAFNKYMPTKVLYAMKANFNPALLAMLRDMGSWIDATSLGEVEFALRVGFPAARISFTPANASLNDLRLIKEIGVNVVVMDSLQMIQDYSNLGGDRIGLRLNPGISAGHSQQVMTGSRGSKFGISPEEFDDVAFALSPLHLVGLHAHIGSGIKETQPYEMLVSFLKEKIDRLGKKLEFVDIGGGYDFDDERLFERVAAKAADTLGDSAQELRVEPGRYLVKTSSVLLTRVNQVKEAGNKQYVGVDAGMNALIRPALYGAVHPIDLLGREGKLEEFDVVGPICENTDFLGKNVKMARPRPGDVLAIRDVGAYGYSMSSNYNLRPRPSELVLDGKIPVFYKPAETIDDIFKPYEGIRS